MIMMKNPHPDSDESSTVGGGYHEGHRSVMLYPPSPHVDAASVPSRASVLAHEGGHDYFRKNIMIFMERCTLECTTEELKRKGVNEGFAKITEHHVTGEEPKVSSPSADNVADILAGDICSDDDGNVVDSHACRHDLGALVYEAYKNLVDAGVDYAYEVYRDAIPALNGEFVTPARLHEIVGENIKRMLDQRGVLPRPGVVDTPPTDSTFTLEAWLRWLWAWRILDDPPNDESPH